MAHGCDIQMSACPACTARSMLRAAILGPWHFWKDGTAGGRTNKTTQFRAAEPKQAQASPDGCPGQREGPWRLRPEPPAPAATTSPGRGAAAPAAHAAAALPAAAGRGPPSTGEERGQEPAAPPERRCEASPGAAGWAGRGGGEAPAACRISGRAGVRLGSRGSRCCPRPSQPAPCCLRFPVTWPPPRARWAEAGQALPSAPAG